MRYIKIITLIIAMLLVPELVMHGEDGNLLVRIALMVISAAVVYLAFWLLKKLR